MTDTPDERGPADGSSARLDAVLDTAVDGILTIDAQGIMESANPAARRIFGYRLDELIGRNVSMLMPSPDREAHDDYLRRYLAGEPAKIIGIGREVVGLRKDGTTFPMELAVSEVRYANELRFTGFVRDISDRHAADAALRATQAALQQMVEQLEERVSARTEALQRANEELQSFARVVSHDLKAPLRNINTLRDWLGRDCGDQLDEKGQRYIDLMGERIAHLERLIDGILDYSRIGRVEPSIVDVDTANVAREVAASIIPPESVQLEISDDLPVVRYDRVRFSQVLQNLISNAVEHMGDGGRIEVGCEERDDDWVFFVRDDGVGIDARHLDRIFEMFQRLGAQETSTGVGLSIVKRIVEIHGGRISVESKPGEGSAFRFTVPKRRPPTA